MSDSSRAWLTPSNILTVIGIVVGAFVGMFGVAFANPTGQRILCNLNSFFCDDVKVSSASLTGDVFDFGAWCEEHVRQLEALPELDRPPGVSAFPSAADCRIDLGSDPDAAKFMSPLQVIPQSEDAVITVNLTLLHAEVLRPLPFSVAFRCGHLPPGATKQTLIPCEVQPLQIGNLFQDTPASEDTGARPRLRLDPTVTTFVHEWRLQIAGADHTGGLEPGVYSVSVDIAREGDAVQQTEAGFTFEVQ